MVWCRASCIGDGSGRSRQTRRRVPVRPDYEHAYSLKSAAARLARNGSDLRFCYEAGPCGYGIQRQLTAAGHECVVVTPSLIPPRPGDRIKTDRRDAINLAKLHRAGELTTVWIPDQTHEAIRDLLRAGCGRPNSGGPISGFLPEIGEDDRDRLDAYHNKKKPWPSDPGTHGELRPPQSDPWVPSGRGWPPRSQPCLGNWPAETCCRSWYRLVRTPTPSRLRSHCRTAVVRQRKGTACEAAPPLPTYRYQVVVVRNNVRHLLSALCRLQSTLMLPLA